MIEEVKVAPEVIEDIEEVKEEVKDEVREQANKKDVDRGDGAMIWIIITKNYIIRVIIHKIFCI